METLSQQLGHAHTLRRKYGEGYWEEDICPYTGGNYQTNKYESLLRPGSGYGRGHNDYCPPSTLNHRLFLMAVQHTTII